jgi:hypothetical protein
MLKKELNLVYARNISVPFMLPDETGLGIVLIPSDQPIPPVAVSTVRFYDFEFELAYEDKTWDLRFSENSTLHWTKLFLSHDFVPSPPPPSPTDNISFVTNPRAFSEYVSRTRANRKYIETSVTTRTWFWKQVGASRNIHWCYYSIDIGARTEYNYGNELLEQLNEYIDTIKHGRYIVNQIGNGIISGSWLLKRNVAQGCDIPPNVGNILIDNIEYPYESIFGA